MALFRRTSKVLFAIPLVVAAVCGTGSGAVITECTFDGDLCDWQQLNAFVLWKYSENGGLRLDTLRTIYQKEPTGLRLPSLNDAAGEVCLAVNYSSLSELRIGLSISVIDGAGSAGARRLGYLLPQSPSGTSQQVTMQLNKDSQVVLQVNSPLACNDTLRLTMVTLSSGPCSQPAKLLGDNYTLDEQCVYQPGSPPLEIDEDKIIPTIPSTAPTPALTTFIRTAPTGNAASRRPFKPMNNLVGSCDFEEPHKWCNYTSTFGLYRWTRENKTSDSLLTGPIGDHTTGKGFYAYAKGSLVGRSAVMTSPLLSDTEDMSVCFFYHMFGSQIGKLTASLMKSDTKETVELWSKSGDQGDEWHEGCFLVSAEAPYQISFESFRSSVAGNVYADVAIDDILFESAASLGITKPSTIARPQTEFATGTTPGLTTRSDSAVITSSSDSVNSSMSTMQQSVSTYSAPTRLIPGVTNATQKVGIALDDATTVSPRKATNSIIGSCDFEEPNKLCGYTVNTGLYKWERVKGSTTNSTGPQGDSTTGSGFCMLAKSSGIGRMASLTSPKLTHNNQPMTLCFSYHMYGPGVGKLALKVLAGTSAVANEVWSMAGNQGNKWYDACLNIVPSGVYQVIFESTKTSTNTKDADVAIDDILFELSGNPTSSSTRAGDPLPSGIVPTIAPVTRPIIPTNGYNGTCNFEEPFNTCGYTTNFGVYRFERTDQSSTSTLTGPKGDHTTGVGYYMYAKGNAVGKTATLTSPTLSYPQDVNVCFFYHMYGSGVGKLSLRVMESGKTPVELWSKGGNQGNEWQQACVSVLARAGRYTLQFESSRMADVGNMYSDIAIDDISFATFVAEATEKPKIIPTNGIAGSCNFEDPNGLCNYTTTFGVYRFERTSAASTSPLTGPRQGDHTTGYGYFMYARGNAVGKSATLTSPTLSHAQDMKVCFFYHMYGSGVGKLSFSVLESGKAPVELWTKSGNQGDQWIQACVTVTARANPYTVQFDSSRTSESGNLYSDVAIDDISFEPTGSAITTQRPITSTNVQPVSRPIVPTNGIAGSCNFEDPNGLCNYTTTFGVYRFERTSAASTSPLTGPRQGDHTTGYGYFMYARGNAVGKSATLTSPTLSHAQDMKVCFFYHMYGSGVGKLSFSVLESGKAPVELWTKSGDQGDQWIQACVTVTALFNPYTVYFESSRISEIGNQYSDVAIDDISFEPFGTSVKSSVTPSPALTTWSQPQSETVTSVDLGAGITASATGNVAVIAGIVGGVVGFLVLGVVLVAIISIVLKKRQQHGISSQPLSDTAVPTIGNRVYSSEVA